MTRTSSWSATTETSSRSWATSSTVAASGVVGFVEFRNQGFVELAERGLEFFDLEYDVQAFNERLPRVRIIPIDEFDPAQFL